MLLFDDHPRRHIALRWFALLFYAWLVVSGVLRHSLFGDETDSWVFVRDTNFGDFIHYFRFAGHPPLWYMVLMPFARSGLPVEAMAVVNTVFALGVAWLIAFRAPFALWLSLALLFSLGISLQYAIIQRGYMLMLLVMFLIATVYPQRMRYPWRYAALLAMLFNAEAFSIIPAGCWRCFSGWSV